MQATRSPIAGYVWPSLLANPTYSHLSPEEKVLKLHHAMRNILLLRLFIEQNAATDSHSPQMALAPPAIDRTFPSNPRNYESTHPYILSPVLPREYQQAGPSSGAPFEFQSNSTGGSSPLLLQPQS